MNVSLREANRKNKSLFRTLSTCVSVQFQLDRKNCNTFRTSPTHSKLRAVDTKSWWKINVWYSCSFCFQEIFEMKMSVPWLTTASPDIYVLKCSGFNYIPIIITSVITNLSPHYTISKDNINVWTAISLQKIRGQQLKRNHGERTKKITR